MIASIHFVRLSTQSKYEKYGKKFINSKNYSEGASNLSQVWCDFSIKRKGNFHDWTSSSSERSIEEAQDNAIIFLFLKYEIRMTFQKYVLHFNIW